MISTDTPRLESFFADVTGSLRVRRPVSSLLITHLLDERPAFVRAVARMSELRAVLPKPKSVAPAALAEVRATAPCDSLSREAFADPERALAYLEMRAAGRPVVLLDIGGYFAPALETLHRRFSGQILGVVEDTENGHRRYEDLDKLPCPVISVARSPLKDPEDHLVGQSVVFSTEALLRAGGGILPGRPTTVIGYGKLGSSAARLLHAKGARVTVYDTDPVRRAQALSHGFATAERLRDALRSADLVVCATGAGALAHEDFAFLREGAYLSSVTSAEDELDLGRLPATHTLAPSGAHVTRYTSPEGRSFHLCNDGNAVNFLHGAAVGPFILLVQAEILAALAALSRGDLAPGLHELSHREREAVAALWLSHFNT